MTQRRNTTAATLARRMWAALRSKPRVWLDAPCRALLAPLEVPLPDNAAGPTLDVVMVSSEQVGLDGRASVSAATAAAVADCASDHTVVVSTLAAARVLVTALGPAPHLTATRVILPQCVLAVQPEGLVVVELAAGVSAADLQQRVKPTLYISSRVGGLRLAPAAPADDGRAT